MDPGSANKLGRWDEAFSGMASTSSCHFFLGFGFGFGGGGGALGASLGASPWGCPSDPDIRCLNWNLTFGGGIAGGGGCCGGGGGGCTKTSLWLSCGVSIVDWGGMAEEEAKSCISVSCRGDSGGVPKINSSSESSSFSSANGGGRGGVITRPFSRLRPRVLLGGCKMGALGWSGSSSSDSLSEG